MRKINAGFSLSRIKRIADTVYRKGSNNIAEINKLIIKGKNFTPYRIEKLELVLKKIVGSNETVTIPRESITFLSSNEPYEVIDGTSNVEGNYIILPWNISTELGRESLRRLIEQLPSGAISERNVSGVQFSIYENTDTISIEGGSVSNIELSMSRSLRLDNTEVFQDRIKQLEHQLFTLEHDLGEAGINNSKKDVLILEKDELIGNLNIQINNRQRSIEDLEVKLKNMDATVTSLQTANSTLQATNTNLRTTNTNLQTQVTQLKAAANVNQTVDVTFSGGGNFGNIVGNKFTVNGTTVTLSRNIGGVTFG